ncbi:MAG: hypothetical protein KA436_08745 [Oligoflexales bacterium]|nr:hypothetical protein [Oligoflexales bacterium]
MSTSPDPKITKFLQELEKTLKEKEKLKLAFINGKIHKSYYYSWVKECNAIFISMIRLKRRLHELDK